MDDDEDEYKTLVLYVKGDTVRGHTTDFKLELKNGTNVGEYILNGVSDEWKRFEVSLDEFAGLTDWSSITELVIIFDDMNTTEKVGTIYVDEISFES